MLIRHPLLRRVGLVLIVGSITACGGGVTARAGAPTSPSPTPAPAARSFAPGLLGCACQSGDPAPLGTATPTAVGATPAPTPPFQVTDITNVDDKQGGDDNIDVTVTVAQFGLLVAETAPDAGCLATGAYASGARIATTSLGFKRADAAGVVRWTFTASPAEQGTASYTFSCSLGSSLRSIQVFFLIQ
jgi:hypothetical protein